MARRSRSASDFARRAETFGFDGGTPWALPALRLIMHTPRAYAPLADAWEFHYPGTRSALSRLVDLGFIAYQDTVVVDVRTSTLAERVGRPLERYRITAKGRRLRRSALEDLRILEDTFPKLTAANVNGVLELLGNFDVAADRAPHGVSGPHAVEGCSLAARTGRWWTTKLCQEGYIRRLPDRVADARPAVPEHWRTTRELCSQLRDVVSAYPRWAPLEREFRLSRERFLDHVDPVRVGLSGATDYDHDITAQRILACLLASPSAAPAGVFDVEPRFALRADATAKPWMIDPEGTHTLFYQPDAIFIDRAGTTSRRNVFEYERFQSRRDAWSHIERFIGYLHSRTLPFEPAVLRFVVDTQARERGYVELIEAFADYSLDHPERMAANPTVLAVSSRPRLDAARDPLADGAWFRTELSSPTGPSTPRLHAPDASPYDEFFARVQ